MSGVLPVMSPWIYCASTRLEYPLTPLDIASMYLEGTIACLELHQLSHQLSVAFLMKPQRFAAKPSIARPSRPDTFATSQNATNCWYWNSLLMIRAVW